MPRSELMPHSELSDRVLRSARSLRHWLRLAGITAREDIPETFRDARQWWYVHSSGALRFRSADARAWASAHIRNARCIACNARPHVCRCGESSCGTWSPMCDNCDRTIADDCDCVACGGCGSRCSEVCGDCSRCDRCECDCSYGLQTYYPGLTFSGDPTDEWPYHLGIEVEIQGFREDTADLARVCRQRGVTITTDGSISSDDGREFNLPPTCGDRVPDLLGAMNAAWRGAGAHVDSSCGTHVHVDMRGAADKVGRVLAVWRAVESAVYQCVPPHRRTGSYSAPVDWQSYGSVANVLRIAYSADTGLHIPAARDVLEPCDCNRPGCMVRVAPRSYNWNRYTSLNCCALSEHTTLEFRLFPGTYRASRLTAYAQIATSVVRAGRSWEPAAIERLVARSQESGRGRGPMWALRKILPRKYHAVIRALAAEHT